MLVLSRKKLEAVIVDLGNGRTLRVSVTEIRGDKVRIGFDAPRDVALHREEVWNAIHGAKPTNGGEEAAL